MSHAFSRSLRSIENEGGAGLRWAGVLAVTLLVAWGTFMVRARVPLYASSHAARIVNERAVHTIECGVAGRIVEVGVTLEDEVEQGQLLFQLDARAEQLALAQERARVTALEGQRIASEEVILALEQARTSAEGADESRLEEARLELTRRELDLRIATDEAQRLEQLQAGGGASELTVAKARNQADKAAVSVSAQRVALERAPAEGRRERSERGAELAQRRRDLAQIAGELEVARASAARLEHELDRRTVRAPAGGAVGELAPVTIGSYVHADQVLGRVVGPGRLVVEADFDPADALGRVRLGQRGELSLAGFPRAEFGTLEVAVERIASEARDGRIRVELGLSGELPARIPLEHGLPGELRVETERVSPAALVLRTVGGVASSTGVTPGG